jgi:hypothetical protein
MARGFDTTAKGGLEVMKDTIADMLKWSHPVGREGRLLRIALWINTALSDTIEYEPLPDETERRLNSEDPERKDLFSSPSP